MNVPPLLEPELYVRILSAGQETTEQPRFALVLLNAQAGDFSLTRRCLQALKASIEQDSCDCAKLISKGSDDLWELMGRFARECFWIVDPVSASSLYAPTFQIPSCDFPLCFETLGLVLLNLAPGTSFLHLHSGTGFACSVAAFLLGAGGVNHGVEFDAMPRARAEENLQRLLRLQPRSDADSSLPRYHARLLSDGAKFDRMLVTDCFGALEDVLSLQDLLNPGGFVVTGFAGRIDGAALTGMIVVMRGEHRMDRAFEVHTVAEGRVRDAILHFLEAENKTVRRLAEGRAGLTDGPPDGAVASLQALALRACCRRSDPIGPLRGDSRDLLRPPPPRHLPSLGVPLAHVGAAFRNFRAECLSHAEQPLGAGRQAIERELPGLTAALYDLAKRFFGEQSFTLWRGGQPLLLPVLQGVMVWLLENVLFVVQFANIQYLRTGRIDAGWLDVVGGAVPVYPVLEAFRAFFRCIDRRVAEPRPPWCFQLSPRARIRRLLTRLAACLWVDAACLVRIVRAMKALCEVARGRPPPSDAAMRGNIRGCERRLALLADRVLNHSERFVTLEAVQDAFKSLPAHVRRIHYDACCLLGAAADVTEVRALFDCFRLVCAAAQHNLIGSGRPNWICPPAQQLRFTGGEGGSLMDPALFRAERDFIAVGAPQDAIPVDDACEFLARRAMSDLQEALWLATSGEKEKRLATLQENGRAFHLAVLEPHLPMPFVDNVLSATE